MLETFTYITLGEILLVLIALIVLPKRKRTMAAMILALGNMAIFITHIFYDPEVLGGSISLFSSEGSAVHLPIWSELGACVNDIKHFRELYTVVTSLFVHANLVHLIGNLLVLLLLAVPFEEKIGAKNLLIIYFSAGVGAVLLKLLYFLIFEDLPGLNPFSNGIGASGAIFGVLGAFVALYPREKVVFPLGFMLRPWPVFIIALLYGAVESFSVMGGVEDGVGHITHFNGLVLGIVVGLILKRAGMLEPRKGKGGKLSLADLEKLAVTDVQKLVVKKIWKEEIPEIKEVWLEEFTEKAKCPRCRSGVKGRKMICDCKYVQLRR